MGFIVKLRRKIVCLSLAGETVLKYYMNHTLSNMQPITKSSGVLTPNFLVMCDRSCSQRDRNVHTMRVEVRRLS